MFVMVMMMAMVALSMMILWTLVTTFPESLKVNDRPLENPGRLMDPNIARS